MTRQYHLPLPHRESFAAEDFLPSEANVQAISWLLRRDPASWPAHVLVLWGGEGVGKTHLLNIWRERIGARAVSLSDPVLSDIVAGGEASPAYVLDEADAAAHDPAAQEWLQHFYNATKALGRPVLLTARRPPAQWGLSLRDIETRLRSCPAVEIAPPDDELMTGILLKLFADRQLLVESGVVDYLAQRLDRTGTALQDAVAKLDEAALEGGRKITVPLAQKVVLP